MTLGEVGRMTLRELPPRLRRAAIGILAIGGGAVWGTQLLAGQRLLEDTQDTRLTAVEAQTRALESMDSANVLVLDFLGCRARQEDEGRDPSGCAYKLPDDVRARLLPPPR